MKKIIYICCLLFIAWLPMQGQNLQVHGSRIELPAGNVIGAAFYEDKEMFFVQQVLPSTENHGFVRQLSSWNLESRTMITKRVIDETPLGATIFSPGHMHVSTTTHRVYICSAGSYLEVMDLETIGTMAQLDGQIIADFAVDDLHSVIFVLSVQRDGSIHLSSYSLLNGKKQKDAVLPATYKNAVTYESLESSLSLSQSGQIGLHIGGDTRYLTHSGIYFCTDGSNLVCTKSPYSTYYGLISQIHFLEQTLLIADDKLANGNWGCIESVDPNIKYSPIRLYAELLFHPRRYCVPRKVSPSGVHYAVGVVEDKYVIGYTGTTTIRPFWDGFITPKSSSWSVWRADTTRVAAVVKEPVSYGMYQFSLRIVASTTEPLFMTYSHASNALYMYTIMDSIGNQ